MNVVHLAAPMLARAAHRSSCRPPPRCSVRAGRSPPRRGVASGMMGPWGLKFLAGGALALGYVALQSLVRTRGSQRRSILRAFERGANAVASGHREHKMD